MKRVPLEIEPFRLGIPAQAVEQLQGLEGRLSVVDIARAPLEDDKLFVGSDQVHGLYSARVDFQSRNNLEGMY